MEANNQLSFIVCWDFSQSPNHRFRVVADQLLQSTCIKKKFLVLKATLGEKVLVCSLPPNMQQTV